MPAFHGQIRNRLLPAICLALVTAPCLVKAQNVPLVDILYQVFEIRHGNTMGSSFVLKYKGKSYLITARHVVEGLPNKDAEVEILRDGYWNKLRVAILVPKNPEVDIAVLQTRVEVMPTALDTTPESNDALVGQQVYFLGFPFELHSLVGAHRVPITKSGTLSGNDSADPSAVVWYIDGFNNPGFSGGPVIFWDRAQNKWKILGVIKGYRPEPAKVLIGGKEVDTTILVNSGILIAYDIEHALQAIDAIEPEGKN